MLNEVCAGECPQSVFGQRTNCTRCTLILDNPSSNTIPNTCGTFTEYM